MSLRVKFNLVILAAFVIGFAFAAFILNRLFVENARTQVLDNARIMMTAANGVRRYTAQQLVPLLPQEHQGKFVAEAVPSYAAQTNFKEIQTAFAGYSYREPAINPTNLQDRASDWEADIINLFRNEPQRTELMAERETPAGPTLNIARPIVVREEACLVCHSTPNAAPASMIRTYGSANGFGWHLNETVGAQVLSIPMAVPLQLARTAYIQFLIALVLIFAVVLAVTNLLLHFLVLQPVKRVSHMAEAISLGQEDVEPYVKPGKDEISALSVAFNRMRESLKHAMDMLK
jgi:HAMP domain-containing protein